MRKKAPVSKLALSLYFVGLLWMGLGVLSSYIVIEVSQSSTSFRVLGGVGDLAMVFGHYAHVLPRFLEGIVTIMLGCMAQKISNIAWHIRGTKTDA